MQNISDLIEQFILDQMDEFGEINLSRNELANYFSCAPSQINYVLSTRFTNPKGYIVESRRGGGGYIKLIKVNMDKDDYIENLIKDTIQDEITFTDALRLVSELNDRSIINDREYSIILASLNDKVLSNPLKLENKIRANILKNILINILKGE